MERMKHTAVTEQKRYDSRLGPTIEREAQTNSSSENPISQSWRYAHTAGHQSRNCSRAHICRARDVNKPGFFRAPTHDIPMISGMAKCLGSFQRNLELGLLHCPIKDNFFLRIIFFEP
jgi:hypothetical protein